MKKLLLQIIIGILIFSCSSTKNTSNQTIDKTEKKVIVNYDFIGKIDSTQLNFIKDNYNWKTSRILIVNYRQPISSCHFDNNKITIANKKWSKNFYSKIDTKNCLKISVLANGENVKNKLDNINYFDDKNDFLLTNFFKRKNKKSCFGVLVLNNKGDYIQYNGHYSEQKVSTYIEDLR